MFRKYISYTLMVLISSLCLQGELIYAQGLGDTSLYYVDEELHPDAAKRSAIIAGTFDASFPEREPNFIEKDYHRTFENYQNDWGGLPQNIIPSGKILRLGDQDSRVEALNRRLLGLKSKIFDEALADKIHQYRKAHGLVSARHADQELIESLNLGFDHYKEVISINRQRAAELSSNLSGKFILVDAASQQLFMYDGRNIVNQMRVIVGSPDNPTPMLAAYISHSVLNPYWNVPPDLTRDRYARRIINGGANYFRTRRFEALDGWTDDAKILSYSDINWRAVASGEMPIKLRQRPGPGNGMGDIKFMFPNRFGVYLHDTHNEASFLSENRSISAGCIRVQYPWVLAKFLYGERPKAIGSKPEQVSYLDKKTPVYVSYFTAVPTPDGFAFREDIYGRDARFTEERSRLAF